MANTTPTVALPNALDYNDPIAFALAYQAAQGVTIEDFEGRYKSLKQEQASINNVAAGVEGLS